MNASFFIVAGLTVCSWCQQTTAFFDINEAPLQPFCHLPPSLSFPIFCIFLFSLLRLFTACRKFLQTVSGYSLIVILLAKNLV